MINLETFRTYCLSKTAVTEEMPFGIDTLVYKVGGKIFALAVVESQPFQFNLKMHPELIQEYRDKYADILPGYHMNNNHWNTVVAGNNKIPLKEIYFMIDHSYELVKEGLSKKSKEELFK